MISIPAFFLIIEASGEKIAVNKNIDTLRFKITKLVQYQILIRDTIAAGW